jgi:hypothetical protein
VTALVMLTLLAADCDEAAAKKAAAAHAKVAAFCANNKLGCDVAARPPSPLNRDEKEDAKLQWVVTASQVHSRDDAGRPRFMPEGAVFARVNKDCAVARVIGHHP